MLFLHSCRFALNKLEVLSEITLKQIFFGGALQWLMCRGYWCQMMTKENTIFKYCFSPKLAKNAKIDPISNEY